MVLFFAEISEVYPTYGRDPCTSFYICKNPGHINVDIIDDNNITESDQLLPLYEELENVADQDSPQKSWFFSCFSCFSWGFPKFGNIFKKIKSMYSRDEKNQGFKEKN